jgi:hypothetical protein
MAAGRCSEVDKGGRGSGRRDCRGHRQRRRCVGAAGGIDALTGLEVGSTVDGVDALGRTEGGRTAADRDHSGHRRQRREVVRAPRAATPISLHALRWPPWEGRMERGR